MADKAVSTADFNFHFEGVSTHELNVGTLAKGLDGVNQFVFAVQEQCFPDAEINLKVTATKGGSFIVALQMFVAAAGMTLLEPGGMEYAANFVSTVMGMLELKKFLGGKKPQTVEKRDSCIMVTNDSGKTGEFEPIINQYFAGAKIENSVINITLAADSDSDVDGISISTPHGKCVTIPRDSFESMETAVVELPKELTDTFESTVVAVVRRSDCYGDLQWEFQTDRVFRAKITDGEWLEKYDRGEYKMYPHVRLKMNLLTTVQLDERGALLPDGKPKYEVTKIIDVIYPEKWEQTQMG